MKTLYRKDNSCNTPSKDLMDKALKDYDEASKLAHHFNSDIPKAIIKFYTDKVQPEGIREELITYTKTLNICKSTMTKYPDTTIEKWVDEYLKSK